MNIIAESRIHHLPRHSELRVDSADETVIACTRGKLWITQENNSTDVILAAGESLVVTTPGVTLVYAGEDAVFNLKQRHAAQPASVSERVHAWIDGSLQALHLRPSA